MKQQEAETLAHADRIGRAVIMHTPDGWKVYLYGFDSESVSRTGDVVETARGGHRSWSSLDTAHKWIRALPTSVQVRIEIDG